MPSTFSPDLRIELIAAGEQPGLWGTTTNTNLGTLIEDAIAGYVSVSITSANQAFTANDGVYDQARNATIALTTTTTAAFAVYAPPAAKQYIIWNTTAYTATIYNSTVLGNTTAAGAGVAVPAGKKVIVFSTGTDFYSVEAANLTGVLAIANGGTGATSFASASLPTYDSVNTFTNKRITARVNSAASTTSPWAWNSDSYDEQCFTALANALTINADAGTPTDGQKTIFRFKDNGTARALTWTTGTSKSFRAVGVLLPTTTTISKTLYVGCIYNTADSRWDVLAVSQEA
jgi:hypothetical protein